MGRVVSGVGALTSAVVSATLHHYPFNIGYSRLLYSPLIRRLCTPLRDARSVRLRGGAVLRVLPKDDNALELALFGASEPVVRRISTGLLRRGDCFLDIGANYGSVGLFACKVVCREGAVHLFEPNPDLCECIRASLGHDFGCQIHLHQIALSDEDGEFSLAIEPGSTGAGSLVRNGEGWSRITVNAREIGSFLGHLLDDRPIGAKIDIEGAEPRVLPWLFRDRRVRFVCFEAGLIERWDEIWNDAAHNGFQLLGPLRHPWIVQLKRIGSPAECGAYKDVLAVRLPSQEVTGNITLGSLARLMRNDKAYGAGGKA